MRRLQAMLLVLILIGGNAAVVQGVAWASMLAERGLRMDWGQAVQSTFSGRERCSMCHTAEALRDDRGPESPSPDTKLLKIVSMHASDVIRVAFHADDGSRIIASVTPATPWSFVLQPKPPPPKMG